MAAPSTTPPAGLIDIIELRSLVFDEFKLVQEKIDRIGEFLFKIRTWSVTVNSGIILAVLSVKLNPLALFVGALATWAFWDLEKHQRSLRDGYSKRALALETAQIKLQSFHPRITQAAMVAMVLNQLHKTPGLAHSSRRDFSTSPRSTQEDGLYHAQFGLLVLTFMFRLGQQFFTTIYHTANELGALAVIRIWEMISCG